MCIPCVRRGGRTIDVRMTCTAGLSASGFDPRTVVLLSPLGVGIESENGTGLCPHYKCKVISFAGQGENNLAGSGEWRCTV